MHFTFQDALEPQTDQGLWILSSRGTSVTDHNQICELVEENLRRSGNGGEFVLKHHPQRLAGEHLSSQDLVVVATLGERAKLARLNPGGRASVFTLREATLLGELPASAGELERAAQVVNDLGRTPVSAYAELLNSRRGLVNSRPASWATRGWFAGRGVDPMDIPDGHHNNYVRHSLTLRRVRTETLCLADQLKRFVAALG